MKPIRMAMLLFLGGILSCGGSKSPTQTTPGQIRIYMVDRTGSYDAVNVMVTEVSVHQAGADTVSGWTVVDNSSRSFNLIALANGASAILADQSLSPGHYTQIRLKLGAGANVVLNGKSYPLDVPSGLQTGIKLTHPFDIVANTLYELTLDFDASRSVHITGNNQYRMAPTIRVAANVISGTISGTVSPATEKAIIYTTVGPDTVSSNADTTSGAFKLMALPAGTYGVRVVPSTNAYRDTTLNGITVVAKQNTSIGTILLRP